jgi:hypothetical protein
MTRWKEDGPPTMLFVDGEQVLRLAARLGGENREEELVGEDGKNWDSDASCAGTRVAGFAAGSWLSSRGGATGQQRQRIAVEYSVIKRSRSRS